METLKALLKTFRELNLTAIAQRLLTKLGGFWGLLARILGVFFLRFIEKLIDQQIKKAEDAIDEQKTAQELKDRAKANADKINEAKTDDELDDAFRDSLK